VHTAIRRKGRREEGGEEGGREEGGRKKKNENPHSQACTETMKLLTLVNLHIPYLCTYQAPTMCLASN